VDLFLGAPTSEPSVAAAKGFRKESESDDVLLAAVETTSGTTGNGDTERALEQRESGAQISEIMLFEEVSNKEESTRDS
jgi:hypothetical protein